MTSLDLCPASTAFILIDLQKGIGGLPLAPHSFSTVLENSNKVAAALRDRAQPSSMSALPSPRFFTCPSTLLSAIHKLLRLPLRPPS